MSNNAISVENLGKCYQIVELENYYTLRDSLMNIVKYPFKLMSENGNIRKKSEIEYIWALKDINFEVKHGEIIGIIGRNGAGKSTLLKILSRITTPTEGRVRLNGRVGSLLEVGTGFHPELTGRENIYLNGSILGMSKKEIERKFDEIVDFAEIEKFLDTPVKRYSSGMYVRLAFAVAAHLEPEILLVDEVLAVGDIAFQKKCIGKIDEVSKEGRTVLFVSHQLNLIRNLTEQCILLKEGLLSKMTDTHDVIMEYEKNYSNFNLEELMDNNNARRAKAHIHSWRLSENSKSNDFNCLSKIENSITLIFEIIILKELLGANINISLIDSNNILIWGDSIKNITLETGTYNINYNFPYLPLIPASYYWKISIYESYKLIDSTVLLPKLIIKSNTYTSANDDMLGVLNLRFSNKIIKIQTK